MGWLFWWNPVVTSGLVYFPGSSVFIHSYSVWHPIRGNSFSRSLIPQTTKIARKGGVRFFSSLCILASLTCSAESFKRCLHVYVGLCMSPRFQVSEVCTLVCCGGQMFWCGHCFQMFGGNCTILNSETPLQSNCTILNPCILPAYAH